MAALWIVLLVWSTTFVVTRTALDSVPPGLLSMLRFAVATALLWPMGRRRGLRLRGLARWPFACAGASGVALYYGLQNLGQAHTSPGNAALLQACLPPLTTLLAWRWLGEGFGGRRGLGLVLGVGGVLLVVGGGARSLGQGGDLLVLAGICAYAFYTVYVRRAGVDLDPVSFATATGAWGLLLLSPWAVVETLIYGLPSLTLPGVLAVGYLGAVASAAVLVLWTAALREVSASVAGLFAGGVPALGYLVALLTGEDFSPVRLTGALVALAGLAVAETVAEPERERTVA